MQTLHRKGLLLAAIALLTPACLCTCNLSGLEGVFRQMATTAVELNATAEQIATLVAPSPIPQETNLPAAFDPIELLPTTTMRICVPSADSEGSGWSLIPEAQAREAEFPVGQCTAFVDKAYRESVRSCLDQPADAHMWNNQFEEKCPNVGISSIPAVGDIAVWEKHAAGNQKGHVAVVTHVNDDGTFDVHEANWAQDTPEACGQDRRCGLHTGDGINFIRMICAITPVPIVAQGAPSYLVVPKVIKPYDMNVFVYYDTSRRTWDGVQFSIAGSSNEATLFLVDGHWESAHRDWTEFWWTYVHNCIGK